MNILILGPAGSGKSSLTGKFGKFLSNSNTTTLANLDPGCDFLPYKPDFDIRNLFTVKKIMEKEKLGPNGALLRAMKLMKNKKRKITNEISKIKAEFKLIDTPGQLEMFVFQDVADIVKLFERPVIGIFLIPANFLKNHSDFVTARFLSIAAQLRLSIPVVNVVSKFDSIKNKEKINKILKNPDFLEIETKNIGMKEFLMSEIEEMFRKSMKSSRFVKVSSKTEFGFEELYDIIHEVLCECGDLSWFSICYFHDLYYQYNSDSLTSAHEYLSFTKATF